LGGAAVYLFVDPKSRVLVVSALATVACRSEAWPPSPAEAAEVRKPHQASVGADPFAFDSRFFEKKHQPQSGDWLDSFHEPGQTFAQYVAQVPQGVVGKRRIIVLQPIGGFTKDELAVLEKLREFTSAYFQLRVRVEKPIPLPDHGSRPRGVGTRAWTQYHTGTLMREVLLPRLPADAVCYLGVTMADLYPDPSWNFVFGEATFRERVGVYSLVRYTNRFWGRAETDESKNRFLRRSFTILAHETGHMFSIAHCTVNECLMNGSNSLEETDRSTIHLCPVCLRKLQWNLKFDVLRHYRELRDVYARAGYRDLADWVDRRLVSLETPGEGGAAAP
jgi:archaemetzincin